jgi:signal transduction histidine kinase
VEANDSAYDLLNARSGRLPGKPLAVFSDPADRRRFRATVLEAGRAGQVHDRVLRIIPKGGEPRDVSVSVGVSHADGRRSGLLWLIRDVTEREEYARKLESLKDDLEAGVRSRTDDLERANAAKDEFLGMISHELRTPITTIYGNAQILLARGGKLSDDERAGAIADIEAESGRLQRLVDDLLVLARLEGGHGAVLEPILPERAIARTVASYMASGVRQVVALIEPGLPAVRGEPTYFEQVLRNLFSNADKYSPPAAPIDVVARRVEDGVEVSVADRGPGIADEDIDHVFAPFFRSQTTMHRASGAGVGLAVCRRLVEAQQGRIWAEPRPGGGTVVKFVLTADEDWDRD